MVAMSTCQTCGRYVPERPSIRRMRAQGRVLELFQFGRREPIDLFIIERLAPLEREYFDRFMARWQKDRKQFTASPALHPVSK